MRAWTAFASLPVLCAFVVACSSSDGPAEIVPSPDGGTAPPSSDGGADADADAEAEAGGFDAGPAKRLELRCAGAEADCYVDVSGNGSRHVCGLLKDGTVRCWGRDSINAPVAIDGGPPTGEGALGRGVPVTALEGATAAKVVGLSGVTQISVGPNYGTCARTSDGSVYCWGRNDFGQLGRPASELQQASAPTRIEGLPPVDRVELGFATACAIGSTDHALYCWGKWQDGMGIEQPDSWTIAPQIISTFPAPVKALVIASFGTIDSWSFFSNDTIVTLLEGDVLANLGRQALKGDSLLQDLPIPVGPQKRKNVPWIGPFAFGTREGTFKRWQPAEETLYVPSLSPVVDVKVSADGAVTSLQGGVLTASGRLFRWGPNPGGGLGVHPGKLARAPYPQDIEGVRGKVVSFATTVASTCASLVDGKVQCWGSNAFGELGRGVTDLEPHPEPEFIR